MKRRITPAQTVGPYFSFGMPPIPILGGADIPGERISIRGRIFDGHGEIVPDGLLETWQANHRGKYNHPEDDQDKQITLGFLGFGRTFLGRAGDFQLDTIRPGPVPAVGGGMQAAHINVNLMARGVLRQLSTRIYFADDPTLDADPVLRLVTDAARRATLIAQPDAKAPGVFRWDVVLQGPAETVFFNC